MTRWIVLIVVQSDFFNDGLFRVSHTLWENCNTVLFINCGVKYHENLINFYRFLDKVWLAFDLFLQANSRWTCCSSHRNFRVDQQARQSKLNIYRQRTITVYDMPQWKYSFVNLHSKFEVLTFFRLLWLRWPCLLICTSRWTPAFYDNPCVLCESVGFFSLCIRLDPFKRFIQLLSYSSVANLCERNWKKTLYLLVSILIISSQLIGSWIEQEIHSLKTQLEAAKFDVIKYCIGISSVSIIFFSAFFLRWTRAYGVTDSVGKLESLRSRPFTLLFSYMGIAEVV